MRRILILTAALWLAAATALASRGPAGLLVWIETDRMRLTLYRDGVPAAVYPIAAGRRDTPSPIGTFRITHRFSTELSGFGTRFLGLNVPWGSYGIHGTNRPESIGSAASHGCIRLRVSDAEKLYAAAPNGVRVVIEGGPFGPLGWGLRPLREGDRGADVRQLQLRLIQRGFLWGGAHGVFGPATKRAVALARQALALPPGDGADAALQKALGMIPFE